MTFQLRNKLISRLKDQNVEKTIKTLFNENTSQDLLNNFLELDELAPRNLKFIDELKDEVTRKAFSQLFPGRGGGSGSAAGIRNLLRFGSLATTPLAPLAAPAFSPLAQREAIKAGAKAGRKVGRGLVQLGQASPTLGARGFTEAAPVTGLGR